RRGWPHYSTTLICSLLGALESLQSTTRSAPRPCRSLPALPRHVYPALRQSIQRPSGARLFRGQPSATQHISVRPPLVASQTNQPLSRATRHQLIPQNNQKLLLLSLLYLSPITPNTHINF